MNIKVFVKIHSHRQFIQRFCILFIFVGLFSLHCSEPNKQAPLSSTVHPEFWVNPEYSGTLKNHGTYAQMNSTESCLLCHGNALQGSDKIPGCSDSCHFNAAGSKSPNGSGWQHGSTSHSALTESDDICVQCHDIMNNFDAGPVFCHNCHESPLNHLLGQPWLDTKSSQFHGNSPLNCSQCHSLSEDCLQCHFGSEGSKAPAESGWIHGYNDRHIAQENDQDVCNQCHNLNRSYSNNPAACHDCHHIVLNHPIGQQWLDTKSNLFHGISSLSCKTCHTLSEDCSQCHFDSTGSKAPQESGYIHGNNEQHKNFEADQTVCNQCHGLNRTYGNDPAACHDCHGIVLNHPTGQSWLDTKNIDFHGNSALSCNTCHNPESDCIQCHFDSTGDRAPAESGWIHGNNDQHINFENSQSICNQCHNLNRSYGNQPASCHDCHELIANHALGQPWLDTKNNNFHGNSELSCTSCHNQNTDCIQCHFGAAGDKAPTGSGWNHGNNNEHKTYEGFIGVCNQCHSLNRSYGNAPVSCHDCHYINHPLGQTWLDNNSKDFHGSSALPCSSCHNLNTECSQCHFGAGGDKSPINSGWIHGNNNGHKDYQNVQSICKQCHDLNRSYGNEPLSCHACHIDYHPIGQSWLDTKSSQFHGDSPLSCSSCHSLSSDCSECHFGSDGNKAPDGSGWSHGNNDGHKDFENTQGVCNKCHDLNRSYGNDPDDCHDCHDIVLNHPTGQTWLDTKSSRFHGNSSLSCASCHSLSSDCTACHFGSDGDKAPDGSGWSHGNNDGHKGFEGTQGVCNKCHDLNRSYGNDPDDCHDCHDIVLNHPTGQSWLDTKSSQFHGDSPLSCSSCHSLSSDCTECHFGSDGDKAPDGSGWLHGMRNHDDYERHQSVCNKCHSINRSYGNDPDRCHDCHEEDDDD